MSDVRLGASTASKSRVDPTAANPVTIIQPPHGWSAIDLRELWAFRDLFLILSGRDVKLRYKQTVLGVTWVILQPLVAALIFAVIFGRFAKLPSDGNPYLLLVFSGLLPWNVFSGALQRAGISIISDARLVSKVYFPRMIIPIASSAAVLIDFAVALVVFLVLAAFYGILPTWHIVALPAFLLLTMAGALGASLWLAAVNAEYRDFVYAMPFVIQIWTFASPVAYATKIVPGNWQWLYDLNPVVGYIDGFRWTLLRSSGLSPEAVLASVLVSVALLISGAMFFRRMERRFADVI